MSWAWLTPVLYAESLTATALAWTVRRRHPEHRPVAWLLTIGLVSDIALRAVWTLYLDGAVSRLGVDAPWTGWPRVVGHVYDALSLAWPAAVAGAAIAAFLRRSPWPAVLGYVVAIAAFVVLHPMAGNGSQARDLAVVELAAVLAAFGCGVAWYRASDERPTLAQVCMMIVTAAEASTLVGPWRVGLFDNWHLSQLSYLIAFAILIVIQGGSLL